MPTDSGSQDDAADGGAPRRVLLVFAHPALQKSRVNRRLLAAARSLDGVTIDDIYEEYPDFDVDARREQALLAAHDVLLLQFPLYWYATPALLKQWLDLVLEHGWAYGKGTALRGKLMLCAVSAGGGRDAYCHEGHNHFTIGEFLRPMEQTAQLCGMGYLPPFVVFGTHELDDEGISSRAADYARTIARLRDGRLDLERARKRACINDLAEAIAERAEEERCEAASDVPEDQV